MNSIGLISGYLSVSYLNSQNIITIVQDFTKGDLLSIIVDDGEEVKEYNYSKSHNQHSINTNPLQWGLIA